MGPSAPAPSLLLVGGPTALIELGGLRLLTDPTFDPPGEYPRPGTPVVLRKLTGPVLPAAQLEPVEMDGLAQVAVRLQLVAALDVALCVGRREDDRRDGLQVVVRLDERKHFAPVHLRKVEVEEDEVRSGCGRVRAFAPEERNRLHAVRRNVHLDGLVGVTECFAREPDVARAVLDEEYLNWHVVPSDSAHAGSIEVRPNRKVDP